MATSTMLALGFHTVIEGHDVFIGALLRAACWFTTPSSEPDGGKTLGDSPDDDSISNPLSSTLCFTDSSSQSVSSSVLTLLQYFLLPVTDLLNCDLHWNTSIDPILDISSHFQDLPSSCLHGTCILCTVVVLDNQSL